MEGIFSKAPPHPSQLSFIHFFIFFGLTKPPPHPPQVIPIPSVGGVWIFCGPAHSINVPSVFKHNQHKRTLEQLSSIAAEKEELSQRCHELDEQVDKQNKVAFLQHCTPAMLSLYRAVRVDLNFLIAFELQSQSSATECSMTFWECVVKFLESCRKFSSFSVNWSTVYLLTVASRKTFCCPLFKRGLLRA